MEIRANTPPGDKDWDEYVRRHPKGTLFHESGWTRSVMEAYRHPAILLTALDGERITGVLPLFHIKSMIFGSRLVSTAFGVYGGILADDADTAVGLARAAEDVARERGARYVEFRSSEAVLADLPTKDLYVTFPVPVFATFEETLQKIPKSRLRRDLRKSERLGFEFQSGIDTGLFYDLYLHTLRYHGTPPFPFTWFEALRRNLGKNCELVGMRKDGAWVGATMYFRNRDTILPFYTGIPRKYYAMDAFVAMNTRMLRISAETGASFMDLGRSKKGTGAYDAKTHWGIKPVPLGYQYLLRDGAQLPNLSPTNPKLQPLIAVWRKLPISATRVLGPGLNASLA